MSRWHCNDCPGPDIEVSEDGVPLCRACEASPNVEEIVRLLQELSAPRTDGSDIRSTSLSWPASLPWTHDEGPALQSTLVDATVDKHEAADVNLACTIQNTTLDEDELEHEAMTSAVYTQRLSTTQLRLLRLDLMEIPDRDMPLHVTLETHELDDCPEYEAVSYTWAGEGGDSEPCKPIYVGPYWDVLIQTENCHSMLRDLRPRRHQAFRCLWVDAICINQNDILERDRQVSRMGDIYRNCMRAVVYLPIEHLRSVRPMHSRRANRPRTRLTHELLLELLRTRYFTRVWVIQELVLAPTVVFHLKDEDVYFFPLGSDVDWERTTAPWAAHMANPRSFGRLKLLQVLERTWHSEAADARDKIFGVLGLLQNDAVGWHKIKPDYSLSARDVFVGAAAYMILVERQIFLLAIATGKDRAPLGHPSWFPDLTRQPSPFTPTDIFPPRVPKSWTDFSDGLFWESDLYHIYSRSPVPFISLQESIASICTCRYGGMANQGQETNDPGLQNSIDSATGALRLDCMRILEKPIYPVDTVPHISTWHKDSVMFAERINSEGLILWEWRTRGAILRIMASNSGDALDDYVRENCYLFVAGQFERTPTLLFLQPEDKTTSSSFILKRAYPIVGMSLFTSWHGTMYKRRLNSTDAEPSRLCGNLSETLGKIRRLSALTLNEHAAKSRVEQKDEEHNQVKMISEDLLRWLFPGEGVVLQDVLPLLSQLHHIQHYLGELRKEEIARPSGNHPHWRKFLEMYRNFLETKCPELQPFFLEFPEDDPGHWISFQYTRKRWSKMVDQDASPNIVLNAKYSDLAPAERRSGQRLINFTQHEHLDEITAKIELPIWCAYLLQLDIFRDLEILRRFGIDLTNDVRQIRPEDRDTYMHELPEEVTGEMGFLWKHETVTIV